MHYVTVFAAYSNSSDIGYEMLLLVASPMDHNSSQSAQVHYEFLKFVLFVHNRRLSNIVALSGDNTSTNRAFKILIGSISICCYLHQFSSSIW